MKLSIKVLSLFLVIGTAAYAADTASILPPAKTTFLDQNGKPLTSGTVDFYIPGTTTRKATWQDAAETNLNTNPVILDAAGRAIILGSGSYRQVVKDRSGNIIWDQITASGGSGGTTPTLVGDGLAVGSTYSWAGMVPPPNYVFSYGQEISRSTYVVAFAALTSTQSIFCTSGSPIITGLSDTTNFYIGTPVELSCVAAGFSNIISKTSTTITLVANANVTTNTNAVIFPWGRGNGTTTFNVPDFRGFVPAGNNNMGGTASSNLTTTYFGSADPNSIGAPGGSQSKTLLLGNLPAYTPAGTIANGAITSIFTGTAGQAALTGAGGAQAFAGGGFASSQVTGTVASSQSASSFTGTAQGGTSTPFSLIQPTKTINYITKVLPDTSIATTVIPITINTTPIIGCTSGTILFNNAGFVSCTDGAGSANLLTSGTLNIEIPSGSSSRTLNTSLSLSGGPYDGTIYSQLHAGLNDSVVRGDSLPGTTTAPNWAFAQFSASIGANYDTQNSLGVQVTGQAFGISAGMVTEADNNTKSDLVGASFGFFNDYNLPDARGYGVTGAATVGALGTTTTLLATEFAASIVSDMTGTGTVQDRLGVNVINYLTGNASRLNSAISVMRGAPGGEYSQVITLNPYQDGTTQPVVLKSTGDVIYVPTAQTINSFINAPLVTVSLIYNTPNAILTGAGVAVFGSNTSAGGISLKGGIGDNLPIVFAHGGSSTFVQGAVAGTAFFTAVGAGANSWQVDHTTNRLSAPSGLTVTSALSVTSIPTSAGAGGLNVCVDTAGVFYKKASCP